ncbi:MAG: hypothetical protein ACRDYA_02040 [Egibacteraceae bacterium]
MGVSISRPFVLVEGRAIPGHTEGVWEPEQRYVVTSGDPKRPWGIDRIDPARGPLVIVEGVFDALALERADVQAVALRTKTLRPTDAAAIRAAGITTVYLGLDATPDVTAVVIATLIALLPPPVSPPRRCVALVGDLGLGRSALPVISDLLSAVVAGMATR